MPSTETKPPSRRIHVVAAVIYSVDHSNQILISRRPDHLHQGGLWEFPGGKVETDELPEQALGRELREELGIQVTQAQPYLQVSHDYSDKQVLLDIWQVNGFSGLCFVIDRQISPLPYLAIKLMASGVAICAGTIKSPSFSLSGSSTKIYILPFLASSMISSMGEILISCVFLFITIYPS